MASGCIIGECKFCEEWIWEDEDWQIDNNGSFYHTKCITAHGIPYISKNAELKLHEIEEKIKFLESDLNYYNEEIKMLKQTLMSIKEIPTVKENIDTGGRKV